MQLKEYEDTLTELKDVGRKQLDDIQQAKETIIQENVKNVEELSNKVEELTKRVE